jgi:hypothetical protein
LQRLDPPGRETLADRASSDAEIGDRPDVALNDDPPSEGPVRSVQRIASRRETDAERRELLDLDLKAERGGEMAEVGLRRAAARDELRADRRGAFLKRVERRLHAGIGKAERRLRMTSLIDATVPVAGNPTTASVRANFATAKNEISALQTSAQGAPFLPLAGATMKGPMLLYNDPTAPMSPVTLGYFQANGGGGPGSGGIPEAPSDGVPYGRQDASWQHVLGLAGGTMTGAIKFGSVNASSVTDLSKHIDLFGGTHGFNVGPGSNLNYNAATGASHAFLINGAAAFTIAAALITSPSPISLPADPTTAGQAARKAYVDAQVATKLADAPNDGRAYNRMSQAWAHGVPQAGTTDIGVVESTNATNKQAMLAGPVTATNPTSDGFAIGAKRIAAPFADGNNFDGPFIQLHGPNVPTYANHVHLYVGNDAAGYKLWQFNPDGSLNAPGSINIFAAADATILLNKGTNSNALISGATNNSMRWQMFLGTSGAESGGNIASDFALNRYNDSGTFIDTPFMIARSDGSVRIGNGNPVYDPLLVSVAAGHTARTMYSVGGARLWSCGCLSDGRFAIGDETGSTSRLVIDTASTITITGDLTLSGGYGVGYYGGHWVRFSWDGQSCGYTVDNSQQGNILTQTNARNFGYAGNAGGPTGVTCNGYDLSNNLYGTFVDAISDIRIKENIAPTQVDALATLLKIPVTEFTIKADAAAWLKSTGMSADERAATLADPQPAFVPIGLVAQQVEPEIPEATNVLVHPDPPEGSPFPADMMHLIDAGFTPYFLRAIQQIAERVTALETGR